MTKYRSINCLIVLSALALPVPTAAHAASYAVTDLGTLGGTESFGSGLNAGGQVAGTWRTVPGADGLMLDVRPLRRLTPGERRGLAQAATRYERFLGVPVSRL